jgi:hypothetical protein
MQNTRGRGSPPQSSFAVRVGGGGSHVLVLGDCKADVEHKAKLISKGLVDDLKPGACESGGSLPHENPSRERRRSNDDANI